MLLSTNHCESKIAYVADVFLAFSKRGERAIQRTSSVQNMVKSVACERRRISVCRLSLEKITSVAKWGRDEKNKRGEKAGGGGEKKRMHFLPHFPLPAPYFFAASKAT